MAQIKFIGLNDLEDIEKDKVQTLAEDYGNKIDIKMKNVSEIIYHIKLSHKGGKEKQYEVTLRVVSPSKSFEASALEWDLAKVTHKVFKEMIKQVDRVFNTD